MADVSRGGFDDLGGLVNDLTVQGAVATARLDGIFQEVQNLLGMVARQGPTVREGQAAAEEAEGAIEEKTHQPPRSTGVKKTKKVRTHQPRPP